MNPASLSLLLRRIVVVLCLTSLASPALAQGEVPKFLFVVNYLDASISSFRVEPLTGQPTEVPGSPFPAGPAMQGIALSPNGNYLYASGQSVFDYRVDTKTGALTQIASYPLGTNVGRLILTPNGKFIYAMGDGIFAFSVNAIDGTLIQIPGSPFYPAIAFAGGAVTPDSRYLYTPTLIPDGVNAYEIQPDGTLFFVPGSPYYDPNSPTDSALDPSGKYLYIANYGGGISGFAVNPADGTLTTLPNSPYSTGGNAPNSIAATPDGRAIIVDNQAEGTTASLRIQNDGSLSLVGSPQPAGSDPGGVTVDPTNEFVYTSATTSSNVSAYRLDPKSLALQIVPGAQWATGTDPYAMTILAGSEFPYCPLNNVEPSITLCSPSSATASPARIVAGTTSGSAVQKMTVLVDGDVTFSNSGSEATDTFINIPAGEHTVTVQVANGKGQRFSIARPITVSGTSTASCGNRGIYPSVNICSPLGGSRTGTSIHVVAQSANVSVISATNVYLDGKNVYSAFGDTVNTYVSAAQGSHRITVQSTDSSGASWSSTAYVTTQ
jgi:6-phosphogluconolactonase (cycloisomerase 2 family)